MAAPPDGSKDSDDALHSHNGNASVAAATASLFPAYAAAVPQQAPAWLQNTSFAAATTYKPAPTADDQEARRLRLQQAAEQLLPSSSDSDSDDVAEQPAFTAAEGTAQAVQVPDSDTDSKESMHRKHKRRREHSKHKKRKKHRREKKRQKSEPAQPPRRKTDQEKILELERRAAAQGGVTRGSAVSSWADEELAPDKMYFVDSHGDQNNLVYNGLYRGDVAAYYRLDPSGLAKGAAQHHGRQWQRSVDPETDAASQKMGAVRAPRYFGANQARAERNRGMKRLRLGHSQETPQNADQKAPAKSSLPLPAFIPFQEHKLQQQQQGDSEDEESSPGESQDQFVLRRTKEFNIAVRERPHELQLWLDYATFQDEATRGARGRRGVQAGVAEKKISILERALEFHPGSDRLLMALLDAAQAMSSPEDLQKRWQVVLTYHGASPKLWQEYLHWQRAQYGVFAVPQIRSSYQNAVQALKRERMRRERDGAPQSILAETEEALIGFFTEGLRFQMQAGHMERAIANLQVALEYSCFAPAIPVGGEEAKAEAFRAFWESGAPLVGGEGAKGWSHWETLQGLQLHSPAANGAVPRSPATVLGHAEEEETGGWGEWVPLMPETPQEPKTLPAAEAADAAEAGLAADEDSKPEQEEGELVEVVPEPTDEELLQQLGLQLEQQLADLTANDALPAGIMQQWAEEELRRDTMQWQPARGPPDHASDEEANMDSAETLSFQDVKGSILGSLSDAAKLQLASLCLELLGAPLGPWQSSNAAASQEAHNSTDRLSRPIAQILLQPGWLMQDSSSALLLDPRLTWLAPGAPPHTPDPAPILAATHGWFQSHPTRQAFLSRVLALLISGPLQGHLPFCEALLAAEAAHMPPTDDSPAPGQPGQDESRLGQLDVHRAREAAKQLLAEQRGNLGMWAAYAGLESKAGQYKAARKVYETALGSLKGLQASSSQQHAASLALAFAESELSRGGNEAPARALHVLAWLGAGGAFAPFKAPDKGVSAFSLLAPEAILKARLGFQTQLSQTLSVAAATFDATSAAVVAAAALFEELLPNLAVGNSPLRAVVGQGGGVRAALALFQHAFDAIPEQVQRSSAAAEGLRVKQCSMLMAYSTSHHPAVTPGLARQTLLQALEVYPQSVRLLGMLAEAEQRGHTLSRLRRHLTSACQQTPAALLWLMAIKAEAVLPAASYRVQALFEQAIAEKESQHFPLLWRCYMSYELSRGRPDAARRVLLRAVHTCPGAKALWLDGLHFLAEQMPGTERQDLLQLMTAKGLRIRTDTYEILLKKAAEGSSAS